VELIVSRQNHAVQVAVHCQDQFSHHFDLRQLIPAEHLPGRPPQPLADPLTYGRAVYAALFPAHTLAAQQLAQEPEHILFVAADPDLQAIPWEYAYGADGFLVCDYPFVRGLPSEQRIAPPSLAGIPLHIVAIPSNPLAEGVDPLNIDGEWVRLTEVISQVEYEATLERVRPPTLEQLRRQVANKQRRVIHFMGHGGRADKGALLLFEQSDGGLDVVTARDFISTVGRHAFLVTLNACVSATPGETEFNNLAAALVARKLPYALGMRFPIPDEDARLLSRVLYHELAQGSTVEEAVRQVRLGLARGPRPWTVGVPVLYTSLRTPAAGFTAAPGRPALQDPYQPRRLELSALPRVDGTFQGRLAELLAIGRRLTGDDRPRLLTIQGGGGQGKTALAREAGERLAHAFPGGVWAISLESLPARSVFVAALGRFFGLQPDEYPDTAALEQHLLRLLPGQRLLVILDNAESLLEALDQGDEEARDLLHFLRHHLSQPMVTLLATSRRFLEWPGEVALELGGLLPETGAQLFWQATPQRRDTFALAQAAGLSHKLGGHPLSLRLLAGAYNEVALTFDRFVAEYEKYLLSAEDRLQPQAHRHRTLAAAIETSVQFLDGPLRSLLSGLWLFHDPFLPETAVSIFDPDEGEGEDTPSLVFEQLAALHRRGLLASTRPGFRQGRLLLYQLLPTLRPYIRQMPQAIDQAALLDRFGQAMAELARLLYRRLDEGGPWVYLAQQGEEDLERGLAQVTSETAATYYLHWGWIRQRLGDRHNGLRLTELALEVAQGNYPDLALSALNNMAGVYSATGQPAQALQLYQQALPIRREVGDRAGEAATLNGLAYLLIDLERFEEALGQFEESLILERGVGHIAGEVAGLVGKGILLIRHLNQPEQAIASIQLALSRLQQTGLPQDAAGHTLAYLQKLLVAMQKGDLSGTPSGASAISAEVMQAVRDFVNADSSVASRQVVASHLELLLTPEVDDLFTQNITQAQTDGAEQVARILQMHRDLLRRCRASGIEAAFAELEASHSSDLPFSPDLVPRTVAALLGDPAAKMAHAGYVSQLLATAADDDVRHFYNAVQTALFGGDLSQLGQNMTGVFQSAWAAIILGLQTEGGDPEPQ
jgi:tetratricopeptide (TPR) repeat protein